MTNEDKQLLLKDLCARLPYGVICKVEFKDSEGWKAQNMSLKGVFINECYFTSDTGSICSKEFKPYLRPLSSMTEEESKDYIRCKYSSGEVIELRKENGCNISTDIKLMWLDVFNWLNVNKFDYLGLIPKGLAIEALKGMYD